MFGIAFDRHENIATEIANLANNITSQLATERCGYALSRIPYVQWQPCPLKPKLFNPPSIFISLFGTDRQYEEIVNYLKDVLIDHRNMLSGLSLGYCDLRGTTFFKGGFEKTSLMYSKLDQAIFVQVNFKNANFFYARLINAWFTKCNFEDANLKCANLEGAIFHECDLDSARGIELDQLLKCKTLFNCKLRPSWIKVIKRDYPDLLKWHSGPFSRNDMGMAMNRLVPPYFEKIYREHTSK